MKLIDSEFQYFYLLSGCNLKSSYGKQPIKPGVQYVFLRLNILLLDQNNIHCIICSVSYAATNPLAYSQRN